MHSLHNDTLLIEGNIVIRPHVKAHKSRYIAKLQLKEPIVIGLCCQKVKELEEMLPLFTPGDTRNVASIKQTLLLTNEVVDSYRIEKVIRANVKCEGRLICVVDNLQVLDKFLDAQKQLGEGYLLQLLVEVNVGQNRCGVEPHSKQLVDLVTEILKHPKYVKFAGIQAYHGANQHIRRWEDRRDAVDEVSRKVKKSLDLIYEKTHVSCGIVTGGGTGTYEFEASCGLYNEIQPGSYLFMDVDYGKNFDRSGLPLSRSSFPSSLFVLSTVISKTADESRVVLDCGLKGISLDSGVPLVYGRPHLEYTSGGDEHGILTSKDERPIALNVGDKVLLVPGHCDPTVNMYNEAYFVGRAKGEEQRRTLELADPVERKIRIDGRGPGI